MLTNKFRKLFEVYSKLLLKTKITLKTYQETFNIKTFQLMMPQLFTKGSMITKPDLVNGLKKWVKLMVGKFMII